MAVTLTWVRDNYDNNKNRYIDDSEEAQANEDWYASKITDEQASMVNYAHATQTLLPAYPTAEYAITFASVPAGAALNVDGVEII